MYKTPSASAFSSMTEQRRQPSLVCTTLTCFRGTHQRSCSTSTPLRAMNTSHKWHPPPGPEVHQLSSVLARNGLGQYADVLLKEDVSLDTLGF